MAVLLAATVFVLLRGASATLDAVLESRFGSFPTAQRFGHMTWFWAFNETSPLRFERWGAVFVLTGIGSYVLLRVKWVSDAPEGGHGRRILYGVVPAALMILFWLFRARIAWGDTGRYEDYMLRGLVPGVSGPPQPKALFMSSPLTTLIFYGMHFYLLMEALTPEDSVALANVLAGGVFAVTALVFVYRLAQELRVPTLLLLFTAPSMVLFFGYREATAWSAAFSMAFLVAGHTALQVRRPLLILAAALFLGLAVAAHGLAFYLLPALLWMIVAQLTWNKRALIWRGTTSVGALALFIAPLRSLFGLAALRPDLVYGVPRGDAGFEQALVPKNWHLLMRATCVDPSLPRSDLCYTLFSPHQLLDLANITARLAPALLVGLVAILLIAVQPVAWRSIRARLSHWIVMSPSHSEAVLCLIFWGVAAIGSLSFLILFPPGLGFEHDWDLYAPGYLVVTASSAVFANVFLPVRVWNTRPVQFAAAILVAVNAAGLVEFLLLLQPWLVGSILIPSLHRMGW